MPEKNCPMGQFLNRYVSILKLYHHKNAPKGVFISGHSILCIEWSSLASKGIFYDQNSYFWDGEVLIVSI